MFSFKRPISHKIKATSSSCPFKRCQFLACFIQLKQYCLLKQLLDTNHWIIQYTNERKWDINLTQNVYIHFSTNGICKEWYHANIAFNMVYLNDENIKKKNLWFQPSLVTTSLSLFYRYKYKTLVLFTSSNNS